MNKKDDISKESFESVATDEQLATETSVNNSQEAQEILFERYKNLVRAKARTYFLIGADKEDLIQEGMIGLYKAMRDYNTDKNCSFRAFAELCITRHIITAIKAATRKKHTPLNSYVSFNKTFNDEQSDRLLVDTLISTELTDPEELLIDRESMLDIEERIEKVLSPLEKDVLRYYLNGLSYVEIAKYLNRHVKSIDNALQRIKKKLEKELYVYKKEQ